MESYRFVVLVEKVFHFVGFLLWVDRLVKGLAESANSGVIMLP